MVGGKGEDRRGRERERGRERGGGERERVRQTDRHTKILNIYDNILFI